MRAAAHPSDSARCSAACDWCVLWIVDLNRQSLDRVLPGVRVAQLKQLFATANWQVLFAKLAQAEREPTRPTVLFAYTIKGWGLPITGHPLNHSMLLTDAQIETLRQSFGIAPEAIWDAFAPDTPEGYVCAAAAKRLYPTLKQWREHYRSRFCSR